METPKDLPYSEEAEVAVLSAFLTSPEALEHVPGLNAGHFLTRSRTIIFESILDLVKSEKSVDMISVTDWLRASGRLEDVGGAFGVSQLASAFPTSAHVQQHIDILKEKYRLRCLIFLASEIQQKAYEADESRELLNEVEARVFAMGTDQGTDKNQLEDGCAELDRQIDLRRKGGTLPGIKTGIPSFDSVYFGILPGQYYVIGGRPSAGKTAFADQVTLNFLSEGKRVLYVSLESSRDRVIGKLATKKSQTCYSEFIRNRVDEETLEKISRANSFLKKTSLVVLKIGDLTGQALRSTIRREKRNQGLDLVVIDYLQLFYTPHNMEERRALAEHSKQIQRSCHETGVPALVLVQLNRESEKESRPKMRHIKECGQVEQDADNVSLLWCDKEPKDVPLTEFLPVMLSIEKNKDGPSGLDQELFFDRKLMTFREIQRTFKH